MIDFALTIDNVTLHPKFRKYLLLDAILAPP